MKNTEDKIQELQKWLQDNHPEHMARPMIENDLRALKKELAENENNRTHERDTFDLREHVFTQPTQLQWNVDQKIDFILQIVIETNIENLYMAHARSLTII